MIAVILPLSSFAQGVDFKSLTMKEAQAVAEKEKKMIFIDFYTTWCGPCKMMSSEVFTQDQVGEYFNRTFVNLKVDAEKGEGVELAKKYQVKAYPTFVVLRADGTEVYRTAGARPADEFVDKIRKGIDPKWSPEGLTRRYEKGERTPELVNEYALLQMESGNGEIGGKVVQEYFDKLSDKKRVKPENFSFRTELFGPLLSVACIENLEEGIKLVNSLDYGLTSGLQSLDEEEQKLWKNSVIAGNLYINRGITGAIVNRQPFGGMKLSAFGGGIKAGGPNYCTCFVEITDKPDSQTDYIDSYFDACEEEFMDPRDVNKLYGEQNVFRYLPLKSMILRLFPEDTDREVNMISYASELCRTPLTISFDPSDDRTAALTQYGWPLRKESLEDFLKVMPDYERVRTCSPNIPKCMYERAAETNMYIVAAPPMKQGRIELIRYFKEQSISFEYHRYGSISEVPPYE